MAQLHNITTNYEEVSERGDFTPIQPGEYVAAITASDYVPNSANTGHLLKLTLQVLDGEFAGRTVFDNLNLDNPNETTKKIADQTMKEILVSTEMLGKFSGDTETLHNIPLTITVIVEPEKEEVDKKTGVKTGKVYKAKNVIKKYKPLNGASTTASAAPAAQAQTANASAPAAAKAGLPPFLANKAK